MRLPSLPFPTRELGYISFAFVKAGIHHELPLLSIASEALNRVAKMHPVPGARLARAFIQADLESPEAIEFLESLASIARENGWTSLIPRPQLERTDFQKTVRPDHSRIPSIHPGKSKSPDGSTAQPGAAALRWISPELGAGSPGPPAFPVGPGGAHSARSVLGGPGCAGVEIEGQGPG